LYLQDSLRGVGPVQQPIGPPGNLPAGPAAPKRPPIGGNPNGVERFAIPLKDAGIAYGNRIIANNLQLHRAKKMRRTSGNELPVMRRIFLAR
jgi:hypothetical protein